MVKSPEKTCGLFYVKFLNESKVDLYFFEIPILGLICLATASLVLEPDILSILRTSG